MELKINPEFQGLIPPLTEEEYEGLEQSVVSEGCRDAILIWNDTIVDGHNRYKICQEHSIDFRVDVIHFDSNDEAKIWIIRNQFSRRNLKIEDRIELALQLEGFFKDKAKEKQKGGQGGVLLKQNSAEANTREEVAKIAGVSHDSVSKYKKIKEADKVSEVKGGKSINKVHKEIVREEKRQEVINNLEDIKVKEVKAIEGVYDVVVIDVPWDMKKIERDVANTQVEFDYPTMSLEEIGNISIPGAENCHLFMWTTHKHLPHSFDILKQWGFKYVCMFVWHKNGGFQPFNLPQYNCEFVLYAHKGNPQFIDTKDFFTCFSAPRTGHSKKPVEFYDVVRRVTAGRRIDMFAREYKDGYDVWGKEVDND